TASKCKVFYTFPIKSLHFIFDKSGQNPCQIWNFCLFSKPYIISFKNVSQFIEILDLCKENGEIIDFHYGQLEFEDLFLKIINDSEGGQIVADESIHKERSHSS
ncbi:hypothetical protein UZ35_17045, partial [Heyndrickxia coagulans]